MIRALLFDMGGTLDSNGVHWLDRFAAAYAEAGVRLPPAVLRAAFDAAEATAAVDEQIIYANLETMVARHVGWQLEYLTRQRALWSERRRFEEGDSLKDDIVR